MATSETSPDIWELFEVDQRPAHDNIPLLRSLYMSGDMSQRDVASAVGSSQETVRQRLLSNGITLPHHNDELLRKLYIDEQMSISEMAKHLSVSKRCVRDRLLDADIPVRFRENECHDCGGSFNRLALHWTRSDCDRLSFTQRQLDILTGVLMGDGCLHGRQDPNPYMRIQMTNKPFLEWLDGELGVLSTGVELARTAEKAAEQALKNQKAGMENFQTVNVENYNDQYKVKTLSHPDLQQYMGWYTPTGKVFPDNIELTPELLKMWYVCDGHLVNPSDGNQKARVMIRATNEKDRSEKLVELFERAGFSASYTRHSILIPVSDTERILEWMGEAPPGFEYKWDN